jgi:hypothetical protein
MAVLVGFKEKVHLPLYDAFVVSPNQTFGQALGPEHRLRFFVDIQQKTKLETNLQATGVLPHQHTFEARAMRVVIAPPGLAATLRNRSLEILQAAAVITRFRRREEWDIAAFAEKLQAHLTNAQATTALAELIYSSVTSLIVGEKVMIEMPTFWFPAGAGVSSGSDAVSNHGLPDPQATFRWAEPVFIEAHQNFRVELTFPQGLPTGLAATPGPLRLWVVLDGYLTRDVQ